MKNSTFSDLENELVRRNRESKGKSKNRGRVRLDQTKVTDLSNFEPIFSCLKHFPFSE